MIDKVRNATARFRDINALSNDWVRATPCVSGPDFGAMGVHFVLPARLGDAALNADEPEALIYEPLSGGAFRLVGVPPLLGRPLLEHDEQPGAPPVVVLGYTVWQGRFAGRTDVTGAACAGAADSVASDAAGAGCWADAVGWALAGVGAGTTTGVVAFTVVMPER